MDSNSIQLLLRNIGSLIAGSLVTRGIINSGSVEILIGVVVGIGMLVYSWISKRRAAQVKADTAAVALAMPASATPASLDAALVRNDLPPVALDPTTSGVR